MTHFILIVTLAMMVPLGTVCIKLPSFILGCLDYLEGNKDFNPFHNIKQIVGHWFFLIVSLTAFFNYADALKTSKYSINLEVMIMAVIVIIFAVISVICVFSPRKFEFNYSKSLIDSNHIKRKSNNKTEGFTNPHTVINYNLKNYTKIIVNNYNLYAKFNYGQKDGKKETTSSESKSATVAIGIKEKFKFVNGIPFCKNTQLVAPGSKRSVIRKFAIKHYLLYTYSLRANYPKFTHNRNTFVSRNEEIKEGTYYQAYKDVQNNIDDNEWIKKNQFYLKEALDIIPLNFKKERNIINEYLSQINRSA